MFIIWIKSHIVRKYLDQFASTIIYKKWWITLLKCHRTQLYTILMLVHRISGCLLGTGSLLHFFARIRPHNPAMFIILDFAHKACDHKCLPCSMFCWYCLIIIMSLCKQRMQGRVFSNYAVDTSKWCIIN